MYNTRLIVPSPILPGTCGYVNLFPWWCVQLFPKWCVPKMVHSPNYQITAAHANAIGHMICVAECTSMCIWLHSRFPVLVTDSPSMAVAWWYEHTRSVQENMTQKGEREGEGKSGAALSDQWVPSVIGRSLRLSGRVGWRCEEGAVLSTK